MKVCFVCHGHYPDLGRTSRIEFSQNLASLGIMVDVVAIRRPGEVFKEQVNSNLTVYRFNMPFTGRIGRLSFTISVIRYLSAIPFKYDIIHIFQFRGCSLIRLFQPQKAKGWIMDFRSHFLSTGLLLKRRIFLTRIETRLFSLALVHSRDTGLVILGHHIDFIEIPPGVNLDMFHDSDKRNATRPDSLQVSEEDLTVVYVGSIEPKRKLSEMVEGYILAHLKYPKMNLVLVGAGSDQTKLMEMAHAVGEENIIFTGYMPYTEVPHYVSAADICIAYVPIEPWYDQAPVLKTVEYLAAGKPVLATATRGNAIYINDGENGLLVGDTPAEIAQGLIRLAKDPELRKRFSKAARSSVMKYEWKRIVKKQLLPAYEQLLQRRTRRCRLSR